MSTRFPVTQKELSQGAITSSEGIMGDQTRIPQLSRAIERPSVGLSKSVRWRHNERVPRSYGAQYSAIPSSSEYMMTWGAGLSSAFQQKLYHGTLTPRMMRYGRTQMNSNFKVWQL